MAVLLFASITVAGCSSSPSLKEAQEFSEMSTKFKESTNKLANDIYGSCIRRTQYIQVNTLAGSRARDEALNDCEEINKPASVKVRKASKLVTDYIESIGKLASDDVVSFDDELDEVAEALSSFSIPLEPSDPTQPSEFKLPSEAVNTGVSIAKFIFRWVTDKEREGVLKEAITCTEQPFQVYTDGLEFVYQEGYIRGILEQEIFRVNSYYSDYAALLRDSNGSDRDFRQLERESFSAIEPVLERRNAAESYVAVLEATAAAHSNLAGVFLDGEDLPDESSCAIYFSNDDQDSGNVASKSNGKGSLGHHLTAGEYLKVQEILGEYQDTIEPLIIQMEDALEY